MIQDQLIGDLFRFNQTSRIVTLQREFRDAIRYGEGCPIGKNVVLTFQITSSVIGVSRPAFIVDFKEDPSGVYYGPPRIDVKEEQLNQLVLPKWSDVTAKAVSASMTGEIVISFSEPLKSTKDLKYLSQP